MRLYSRGKSFRACRTLVPAYLRSRIRPRPIWTHFYLTRRCNLACSYCFVREQNRSQVSTELAFRIIDKLHAMGCRVVAFLGGEPTLRKDLPDILRYTSGKGIITHLSTNGTLLTKEYLATLCRSGLDYINLSVDSISSFSDSKKDLAHSAGVLENLLSARACFGLEINVNCVLTRKNINAVVDTVKRINRYNIPVSIGMIIANTYSEKLQDEALFFSGESDRQQLFDVLDTLKAMKKTGYNIIEPLAYFDDVKRFYSGHSDWYCASGTYYLSVDCDGRVMMCGSLKAEDCSVLDLDKRYYRRFEEQWKQHHDECKTKCISNCVYDTSYFIKHPLKFFAEDLLQSALWWRKQPELA
jgi:MoaA/NifB/PqqE/SkfB family radical SAM enzyme